MKYILTLATALSLCLLPSCGLIGSLLKLPASLLRTTGRILKPGLTDEAPQRKLLQEKSMSPEQDHALEKDEVKN